jgi:hypothetical protein
MRCSRLALLLLLPFTASASAQTRAGSPVAHIDEVVARMMSFDRNQDGHVGKDELLERMQHLVTRGDVDGNGALDSNEIRTLAGRPPAQIVVDGFPFSGSYGFGDEVGVSSRSHIEGALDDLRLASATLERARGVASTFVDTLETEAAATLLKAMEAVITPEQLANFTLALDGQDPSRFITFKDAGNTEEFDLPEAQKTEASAAIERYRATLRLGHAERSALLRRLTGVLDADERDGLRAALERRPVVAKGGTFTSRGAITMMDRIRGRILVSGEQIVVRPSQPQPATR